MRTAPITRHEIRIYNNSIIALPADAYLPPDGRGERRLDKGLLEPLLAELVAEYEAWVIAERERRAKTGWDPRLFGKLPPPPKMPYDRALLGPRTCHQCGREFMVLPHSARNLIEVTCSDICTTSYKKARRVKDISGKRAVARMTLRCNTCGEYLQAARSTARYCSGRCRIAAHRARHKA